MTPPRVLLTGGSGFVGRHVLDALTAAVPVRVMVHERAPHRAEGAGIELVAGDLTNPASLAPCFAGVDLVMHLASYVGEDESRCEAVNARGSAALVAAASAAGVRRILYLSSAAVYGYAVHRDADEQATLVAPATPISRSRATAEAAVLEAGGLVLRPLFVYGVGDTRFIPTVARGLIRFPFLVERGRAKVSVVEVTDLARAAARLLLKPDDPGCPRIWHVTDGQPVSLREIAEVLAQHLGIRMPGCSVPYPTARWMMRLARGWARRWTPSDAHRLFLVSRDHYYNGDRLWRLVGLPRPAPLVERFGECADWYRRLLGLGAA
ncbi:MAG: NAD-dependent epimerase/dehydratase family protein [Deltaproteobacteria bacterium]